MKTINYAFAYGKLQTAAFFFASDLVKEGLITREQYGAVTDYIDKKLKEIELAAEKYES